MTIPDHNRSSQISIFLPSSRDGFYVNKSEARYIGMTEYWIPMILDFNQSYLIKDSLENIWSEHPVTKPIVFGKFLILKTRDDSF